MKAIRNDEILYLKPGNLLEALNFWYVLPNFSLKSAISRQSYEVDRASVKKVLQFQNRKSLNIEFVVDGISYMLPVSSDFAIPENFQVEKANFLIWLFKKLAIHFPGSPLFFSTVSIWLFANVFAMAKTTYAERVISILTRDGTITPENAKSMWMVTIGFLLILGIQTTMVVVSLVIYLLWRKYSKCGLLISAAKLQMYTVVLINLFAFCNFVLAIYKDSRMFKISKQVILAIYNG